MKFKLLLIASLLITANSSHAIVMRHDVDESDYLSSFSEWPATAYFHLGERFGNGTGTLVAPQWILTAGHVTHYLNIGDKVTVNGAENTIKTVISHPSYELYSPDNDIGLVELATPLNDTKPALLYTGNDEAGKTINFVGAGRPGNGITGANGPSGTIRFAENIIDETRELLLVFDFDGPEEALPLEGISGPGDSGGPAYLLEAGNTYVLGVSAFQGESPTGVEGVYNVKEFYSRVSAHVDWINSVINASPPANPDAPQKDQNHDQSVKAEKDEQYKTWQ